MSAKGKLTILFTLFLFKISVAQQNAPAVQTGVSLALAKYRHNLISDIQYKLDFNIPADKLADIKSTDTLTFKLKTADQPLQIDFKQSVDHVRSIIVNDKPITVRLEQEHLIIDAKYLQTGTNKICIQFIAGNASLNRNTDYLYALFVPDRARNVFPCFDQPDLKAKFLLTLRVPQGWKTLANAVKKDSAVSNDQIIYRFNNSDKLPTYLFSFTAGKYTEAIKPINGKPVTFLYRETDSTKIKFSIDSIFKAHRDAINFMENWTGIPFPFQKAGFVAIPDFQFGGMEHPGEVQYKASVLFLDGGATKDQFINRSNVISHETAHMWFGDMVTMQWFNDVWMKEVFANFMADKVTEKLMGKETFNLKFLQDHYPAAYAVDRTAGANPIRQQLSNLQDAGSLYGNIIYHKAPIMMRQLELLIGQEKFRQGVQSYLKKYAYSNATWNDLIGILSKYTRVDLYNWNKVWVNQPGMPAFDYNIAYTGNKISHFTLTQHAARFNDGRIWPQSFNVTLVYPGYSKDITVNMTTAKTDLQQAIGLTKPAYIIFDSDGIGYGMFPVDKNMTADLFTIKSPLQRASLYISFYENMLSGRYYTPKELLDIFSKGIVAEKEETNLRLLTGYISTIYWEFVTPDVRKQLSAGLENNLWDAMQQQTATNNKKILFKTYQDIYLSDKANDNIYTIWKNQQAPTGIKLTEDDYTSLALSIALKNDTVTQVLKQQETRITNVDRKKRLEFLMPALSADSAIRDSFFESLKDRKNREKEAWVTTALSYLHHPVRQKTAEKHLRESLDMVEELQKTGDIFFPQSWLSAIFSNYQDKQAAKTVSLFLKQHPNYNPKLKDKILQNTDNLYRAQKLLK
ncbi:aminopeptidase [Mucilaginibacter corticis]|uniref:Aminopeptidase N n=1 Tax=Mucilaginibacter corticis TaxID=2597670 RepID=A0A556MBC2_9SPHI|nr:M1 family aminopeptidase [Mucilaginibacter corticis]TSJ37229.1 aminopeptidase [Mucilaginibacter corticis]